MSLPISTKQAPDLILQVLKAGLCPMLHGSPSTAKSSIIHQIAKENELKVIDLRLSQMDITDLVGLPYFNADHTKSSYIPPDYFPLEGDELPKNTKGWILFLDEITSAPPSMQAASYKIILDRMVGQAKLHKNVAIVAAGNKATDKAIVHRMSTALQSRMLHFEIELNHKDWLDWAARNDIDYRVMAYVGFKPQALNLFDPNHNEYTYACARTWHFISKIIKDIPSLTHDTLPLLVAGLGEGAGREFNSYCQIFDKLITIEQILLDPEQARIDTEPSVIFALSNLLAANMEKNNMDQLMIFTNRLPIEFAIICLHAALKRNMSLLQTKSVKAWIAENSMSLFD